MPERAPQRQEDGYDIGYTDGYEQAVQDLDVATGGDGEFVATLGVICSERHCPDVKSMKTRIIKRFHPIVMPWLRNSEHCDSCGRFVATCAPGVSWSQSWGYTMSGEPDLHDPIYRCSICTDKFGVPATNCGNPERYQGRNAVTLEKS